MANVAKTIEIIFAGTDNVSGTINDIGSNLETFGTNIQDIGAPFADATEKVLILNAAVLALAVAGLYASSEIESEANKMKNSLGLVGEEAARFEDIAKDVYKAGFGDDLAASFEAVTIAQKKFGDNAAVDIGKVTEQAFKLQATFGTDLKESFGAVNTLMSNFGLTADQAFDFITTGFQEGLDGSGDFIESINEYSTQFNNGGADAGQFFSVLSTGFQEGMLGTDRAADLFKEFRVRIQDGSKTTKEALESIGIDPVAFNANLASGQMSAVEAFNIIQGKLNETTDKSVLLNAGVGLMGTQFEDMGTKAALAVNTTATTISSLEGTIDNINTETFEQKFSSLLRTIQTEFGDNSGWDTAKIKIGEVFDDIAASFGPALDNIDLTGLENAVEVVWNRLVSVFTENDIDITTVDGMQEVIQEVIDSVETLIEVSGGIVEAFTPLISVVIDLIKYLNDLDEDTKELAGNILGFGTQLAIVGGILAGSGALISGLGSLFSGFTKLGGLLKVGGTLSTGISGLISKFALLLQNPFFSGTIAFTGGWAIGTELRNLFPSIDTVTQKMFRAIDSVINFSGQKGNVNLEPNFKKISAAVENIPGEKNIDINVIDDYDADFEAVKNSITEIGKDINIGVKAVAETDTAKEELSWFDNEGKEHTVLVDVATTNLEETKSELEEIPTEKILELKLQGEIDVELQTIISTAETVQSAMEWDAKVDIANVEAAAETIKAAFDAAGVSVDATASAASSMFGDLIGSLGDLSGSDKWQLQNILDEQVELERMAVESQISLTNAQVAYLEQKTDALSDGDALITIDSNGLEPALEMIMWEIIQKVQIKATGENADFLLGI